MSARRSPAHTHRLGSPAGPMNSPFPCQQFSVETGRRPLRVRGTWDMESQYEEAKAKAKTPTQSQSKRPRLMTNRTRNDCEGKWATAKTTQPHEIAGVPEYDSGWSALDDDTDGVCEPLC